LHTKDPRTAPCSNSRVKPAWVAFICKRRAQLRKPSPPRRKSLPINVDVAIGAIFADLGVNPAAFNGIFMIARAPRLVAHVIEEQTREKPMRRIDPLNHGYDALPARTLSGKSPSWNPSHE